jgi:hypothetical protein
MMLLEVMVALRFMMTVLNHQADLRRETMCAPRSFLRLTVVLQVDLFGRVL